VGLSVCLSGLLEDKTLAEWLAVEGEPRLLLVDYHEPFATYAEKINSLGDNIERFQYAGRLLLFKRCAAAVLCVALWCAVLGFPFLGGVLSFEYIFVCPREFSTISAITPFLDHLCTPFRVSSGHRGPLVYLCTEHQWKGRLAESRVCTLPCQLHWAS
jgi:hypothetical protein